MSTRTPTKFMSVKEIKNEIRRNFPAAAETSSFKSIKQKHELQELLDELRFANRDTAYSINYTRRQPRRNKVQYSLDQEFADLQTWQQKLARQKRQRQDIQRNRRARQRERAEALRREEQRLARQRERAEALRRAEAKRREEQRKARQRERAKAAREERQRKMRQQASRRNTTSSTTSSTRSSTTTGEPRLTQQEIIKIEKIIPGNFRLGANTVQQLSLKDLKDKSAELTTKMLDKYFRINKDLKRATTTLLHAVNAEILKRERKK